MSSDPIPSLAIHDASTAGRGLLTAADAAAQRALMSVYSTSQVDGLLSGLGALTAADIDTLAELNAILTDTNFATVATTGAYSDLSGLPTLGTAAATAATDYATAAQGSTADSALQPADITSGTITAGTGDIDFDSLGGAESPLTLTAGDATETPLTIQAAASQTAPLSRLTASEGATLEVLATKSTGWTGGDILGGIEFVSNVTAGLGAGVKAAMRAVNFNNDGDHYHLDFFVSGAANDELTFRLSREGGIVSYQRNFALNHSANNAAVSVMTTSQNYFQSIITSGGHGGLRIDGIGGDSVYLRGITNGNNDLDLEFGREYSGDGGTAKPVFKYDASADTVAINTAGSSGLSLDASETAGETRLLLWDVDAGALVRVSVGADDSGGTGFKVLRIPN